MTVVFNCCLTLGFDDFIGLYISAGVAGVDNDF